MEVSIDALIKNQSEIKDNLSVLHEKLDLVIDWIRSTSQSTSSSVDVSQNNFGYVPAKVSTKEIFNDREMMLVLSDRNPEAHPEYFRERQNLVKKFIGINVFIFVIFYVHSDQLFRTSIGCHK